MKRFFLMSVVTVLMAVASIGRAELIAYEGFLGFTDADLDGQQTASVTGFDASETWTVTGDYRIPGGTEGGDLDKRGLDGQATGLAHPRLQTFGGGGKGWVNPGLADDPLIGRLVSAVPVSPNSWDETYFSVLVSVSLDTNETVHASWVHQSGNGRKFGVEIRGTNVWAVQGYDGFVDTGLHLDEAGVHLFVVRATDQTDSGDDEFDLWIDPDPANPGSPDYEVTGGFMLLTETASYGWYGFHTVYQDNDGGSGYVDEFRLGTTMDDVLPCRPQGTIVFIR